MATMMRLRLSLAVVALALLLFICGSPAPVLGDYIAAVAQHSLPSSVPIGSPANLTRLANLAVYASVALAARRSGAQLLAFPEFGLVGREDLSRRETTAAYAEPVPEWTPAGPLTTPCDQPELMRDSPSTYFGSCMARNASLLTLINMFEAAPCAAAAGSAAAAAGSAESAAAAALKGKGKGKGKSASPNCPSDGQFVYNTDLLFDDRGALVAKYRKAHPAFIFSVDKPPKAETVTYTAKFNVTFGLFICFDIAFQSPAVDLVDMGVRDFLYAAAIGPLGRDTAARLWSLAHGAALLLANNGKNCSDVFVKGERVGSTVVDVEGTEDSFVIAKIPKDN